MDRRTFIKAAGLGSVSFAYGCNPNKDRNLFSQLVAPEDMVTGKATWYASTCTECPAGCGVLAKNREGRVIKLEGNPLHPLNKGKLCIRGQAALQAIYDPDRIRKPKLKVDGVFKEIDFDQAAEILQEKFETAAAAGTNRIKMLTGSIGRPLLGLISKSLKQFGAESPLVFEPYSYDSLRAAHQALFSESVLPSYQLDQSDFILSFGADFLETWLSPVEYANKFTEMHSSGDHEKGFFIHIAPYMSLTAANADKFLSVKPGDEIVIAMGLINRLLQTNPNTNLSDSFIDDLKTAAAPYTADKVEKETGVSQAIQTSIFKKVQQSKRPLALGGASSSGSSFSLDLAVGILNLLLDEELSLYDFSKRYSIEKVATANEVLSYLKQTAANPGDLFLFYQTNPLYTLPNNADLKKIFDNRNLFKVSFSSFMDETAEQSDLVFPIRLSLETWDAYAGRTDIASTIQPAMGKLTKAPQIGDVFIEMTESLYEYENYQHYLMDYFYPGKKKESLKSWLKMIQHGGQFEGDSNSGKNRFTLAPTAAGALKDSLSRDEPTADSGLTFMAVPSLRYFDGRGANKGWLNEIPDPVTNIAWESMLMIHPETLKAKGGRQGDLLKVEAQGRSLEAPAYSFKGVNKGVIVMQAGLGHKSYGRIAAGNGENPFIILDQQLSQTTGPLPFLTPVSALTKAGRVSKLPKTDGSRSQYKRKIAASTTTGHKDDGHQKKEGLTMETFPLTLPIEEGYDDKRDVYPAHEHDGYRWGMVIDLDRCIGCSACVAACYAENNVAVVGKEQLTEGREMAWLRIERYEDKLDPDKLIFFPMLCQHCDNAPCEAVCPVYAPYHGKEGLNNQIYNRCIGTRFCAQNCPYKVRRFNWFDWKFDEPLNLQLNPNVTVRMRGVMEKCSFCVQRIKEVHGYAKNDNRKIRDGEVKPACMQTCPTNAITFGNFMDKNSRVYQLAKSPRAYQALGYLNTKSAVIYLKKIVQEI